MPQFAPGEAKTAVAPITVMPSGLNCNAEVFLGPDEMTKVATSGLVPFTSTGVSQDVRLPVTMPSAAGTYHVFIDVYAEGILIAAYQAIEDVVIGVEESHFAYTNLDCWAGGMVPGSTRFRYFGFSCTITNTGSNTEGHKVTLYMYRTDLGKAYSTNLREELITLAPGQSATLSFSQYIIIGFSWCFYVVDDGGGKSAECCFST